MRHYKIRKNSKKIIFLIIVALILFSISLYVGVKLRYKYWHFYIHNRLILFLDKEFRDLLNKYGEDFASFEKKNKVGVLVTYPIKNNVNYSIQLRLAKDLKENVFFFRAEIASPMKKAHYNTGNPLIYMEIPMKYFNRIVEEGLTQNQINRLIETADKVGWEAIELNTEIKLKPPVIVKFNDE
jgi:hypothetical protein